MNVCFHGHTSCPYCWGATGRPTRTPRRRRRCPACGRAIAKIVGLHRTCPACAHHGYHPLRLFTLRRKNNAA